MKKKVFLLMCFLISMVLAIAQDRQVTGVVTDDLGEPLPGATVMVKGTTIGTVTDANGKFSLNAPGNATTLVVKFLGMEDQETAVASHVTVSMSSDSKKLNEVVVTALGISRDKKSLGYATQDVKSDKLNMTGNSDLTN